MVHRHGPMTLTRTKDTRTKDTDRGHTQRTRSANDRTKRSLHGSLGDLKFAQRIAE